MLLGVGLQARLADGMKALALVPRGWHLLVDMAAGEAAGKGILVVEPGLHAQFAGALTV